MSVFNENVLGCSILPCSEKSPQLLTFLGAGRANYYNQLQKHCTKYCNLATILPKDPFLLLSTKIIQNMATKNGPNVGFSPNDGRLLLMKKENKSSDVLKPINKETGSKSVYSDMKNVCLISESGLLKRLQTVDRRSKKVNRCFKNSLFAGSHNKVVEQNLIFHEILQTLVSVKVIYFQFGFACRPIELSHKNNIFKQST